MAGPYWSGTLGKRRIPIEKERINRVFDVGVRSMDVVALALIGERGCGNHLGATPILKVKGAISAIHGLHNQTCHGSEGDRSFCGRTRDA